MVLSTHQRQGLERLIHPGLAEAIVRTAGTRTLFVPRRVPGFVDAETGKVNLRSIPVTVDREPRPQAAVDLAADLIVMGTRGNHGFLDAIRGSTFERVLRGAKRPLLTVPAR